MRYHTQSGSTDCWRTCLACILDIDRDDVPDFVGEEAEGGEQWWKAASMWLGERGCSAISVHDEMGYILAMGTDIVHIASAMGPRGHRHAVVGRLEANENGVMWNMLHDPHPSRSGLSAEPDRFYFLIPHDPSRVLS